MRLLESVVQHVNAQRSSRQLQDTNMELAAAGVVIESSVDNALEWSVPGRIV